MLYRACVRCTEFLSGRYSVNDRGRVYMNKLVNFDQMDLLEVIAMDALARAYEKHGDHDSAMDCYARIINGAACFFESDNDETSLFHLDK